ncbi:MAG: PhnD/SsuA/transferrin family substrate-binding protein [Ardenticatenaceae bacterium]|nr:PhnD/SsuA/transferrin family substrate-binding protein [Anaerolineales bacterium]MCB8979533.1 PhnD/SsuA/transferrin family substrate-binding protein [Ardenticatenaceae bacterium]
MKTRHLVRLLIGVSVLLFVIAACTPQTETVEVTRVVTETTEVEVPVETEVEVEVTRVVTETVVEEVMMEEAALGSEERPIKVVFVPSVEVDQIISGGEVLANALTDATGLNFEVSVPTSYAATIEEMCASPDDTIGFIPAQGYVLANNRCGVTVGAAAVRFGLSWYAAQYVVPFDSPAQSLEDLAGATWCIPDFGSTSGYLYPSAEFAALGIEPGEIIETGSHNNSMLGVYNGDCDFATAFFSPPLLPNYERAWAYGVDDPEIWREAGVSPIRNDEGRTFVNGDPADGGYRILDARSSVSDTAPDIFDATRILAITAQIPNDTVSFGPEFPLNTANNIINALIDFTASDECAQSICSEEFYNWTGLEAVTDSFYDPVRSAMDYLGITEEDILGG